jgi:hypothetical protein
MGSLAPTTEGPRSFSGFVGENSSVTSRSSRPPGCSVSVVVRMMKPLAISLISTLFATTFPFVLEELDLSLPLPDPDLGLGRAEIAAFLRYEFVAALGAPNDHYFFLRLLALLPRFFDAPRRVGLGPLETDLRVAILTCFGIKAS